MIDHVAQQMEVCTRFGAKFAASPEDLKVGIALNVRSQIRPINGLRYPPDVETTGWFIWAGEEASQEADWFKPLHVAHIGEWCPQVLKYLGLSPGWRFLISDNHEDVWFDPSLLSLET